MNSKDFIKQIKGNQKLRSNFLIEKKEEIVSILADPDPCPCDPPPCPPPIICPPCPGFCYQELFNDQYIVQNIFMDPSWYAVRVGIGSTANAECLAFNSSSVPDIGFLLLYQGNGVYSRSGEDGVSIELGMGALIDQTISGGTEYAYAPAYIHMSNGSKFLNFEYGSEGSPYTGDQPIVVSTNCSGECNWGRPTIGAISSPWWIKSESLPPTMSFTVSGVTAGDVGDPTCLLHNRTWIVPLLSFSTFDGYVSSASWGYNSFPDQAGFDFFALSSPLGSCTGPFAPVFSTSTHSPASGYFITEAMKCNDSKNAYSSSWPIRTFDDILYNGSNGFGCVATGLQVEIN